MIQHFKTTVICLGIVLLIGTGTAFKLSEKVQDDQLIIGTCDVGQFDQGTCTLTCTIPNPDDVLTLDSCTWKYYSDDEATAVTLYNEVTYDDTTDIVVSLTLSTYNPGVYECELNISDENSISTIYTGAMSITGVTNPGVNLNEICTAPTDCFALHASCDTTCQCTGAYDIPFTSADDTPACLTHQNEYTHCNIDEECMAKNEDFLCENTVCTCEGIPTTVEEEGREMCIDAAYLTTPCVYNEQCALVDSNSFCNSGACDCVPGYSIDDGGSSDFTTYVCVLADTTTPPPPTTDSTTLTTETTITTASTGTTTAITGTTTVNTGTTTVNTGTTTVNTGTTTANTGTTTANTGTTTANTGTDILPTVPSQNDTFTPNSEPMSGGAITGIVFASLIGCGLLGAIGYTAFYVVQKRR